MALSGEGGIPLFAVYLWVTLGNGFRYGQRYLAASAILSLAGFTTVFLVSDFWRGHAEISVGLLIVLLAIPAYVGRCSETQPCNSSRARRQSRQEPISRENEPRAAYPAERRDRHERSAPRLSHRPQELYDIARSIQTSASTLLNVIEDVLDFSKIEAGRIEIESTNFDLHRLAADTVQIFKPSAERKGVNFTLNIDPRVPFLCAGDPLHLRQILTNLLDNAVKFTERGWVELRITRASAPSQSRNRLLRFEVEDTGIGISPENHERSSRVFSRRTAPQRGVSAARGSEQPSHGSSSA